MTEHREIIQLVIAYTLTGAFVFTVVITCLATMGWIRLADKRQQKKLFNILLVELGVGCVAFFFGFIRLDAQGVAKTMEERSKTEVLLSTVPAGAKVAGVMWSYLRLRYGLNAPFEQVASAPMTTMPFWNPTASPEIRKAELSLAAGNLVKFFSELRVMEYRPSVTPEFALQEILEQLMRPEATVENLARTVDKLYVFIDK